MPITKKFLKYGDVGILVRKYQNILVKTGSKIKPNGEYTIGMMSAVRAFQKKNGLKVTGILDAKTMAKLDAFKAPKKSAKTV